jgi:hypothetical protein
MFGSNFMQNFGIPEMPDPAVQSPQGGMSTPLTGPVGGGEAQSVAPPAGGMPAAPQMPGIGSPGPLGGGVLSSGAGATPQMPGAPVDSTQGTAPAAGLASPFGKPAL